MFLYNIEMYCEVQQILLFLSVCDCQKEELTIDKYFLVFEIWNDKCIFEYITLSNNLTRVLFECAIKDTSFYVIPWQFFLKSSINLSCFASSLFEIVYISYVSPIDLAFLVSFLTLDYNKIFCILYLIVGNINRCSIIFCSILFVICFFIGNYVIWKINPNSQELDEDLVPVVGWNLGNELYTCSYDCTIWRWNRTGEALNKV